jgi:hypothetical protein
MKKYDAGKSAPRGVYLDPRRGVFVRHYDEELALDGEAGVRYISLPASFAVVAGPLAGLVYIVTLPIIIIAVILGFVVYKMGSAIRVSRSG